MYEIAPEEAPRELIEECIVEWRLRKEKRLATQKILDEMEKEEKAIKQFVIDAMLAQRYEGTVVNARLTTVTTKQIHIAEDRALVQQFIRDNDAFELLQFKLSETAIREYEAAGTVIPGLGVMDKYDLSDKKA